MPAVNKRSLLLEIETDDYSDSVSQVEIASDESDSDFLSFAEAAAGGARKYTLKLTLKQNTDATSLWYYIWANSGSEVDVVVRPNGGTLAGPNTPTFSGTVVVSEPNGTLLGGEADKSVTAYQTCEVEWEFTAKPTMDDES